MTRLTVFTLLTFLPVLMACRSNNASLKVEDGYLAGAERAALYYQVMGTGGDTIVVVHGGPGAGMNTVIPSFKPLAEKKDYVLVFYDQRGGGRSSLPEDTTKLKPHYFVEDLDAVRRHFGLGKMDVITHSFGSVLVAEYAAKYPDRLRRLVFHGATGPDLQQELAIRQKKAAAGSPASDSALAKRSSELLKKLLRGKAEKPVEVCKEYEEINRKLARARRDSVTYRGTTCDAPPEAVRYYYRYTAQLAPRYYDGWDFTSELESVEAPLLVVWGEQDSLMIPAQRSWARAVSNGRLLVVPNAGKGAVSANPQYVLQAIDIFFSGRWPEHAEQVK